MSRILILCAGAVVTVSAVIGCAREERYHRYSRRPDVVVYPERERVVTYREGPYYERDRYDHDRYDHGHYDVVTHPDGSRERVWNPHGD